jgi:hypothetical protein
MTSMPTLRRAALLGLTTLLVAAVARAQTAPPPATSPPPPPPAPAMTAGAPAAATAPAGPVNPVEPLSPTLAPEPAQAPPLQLTERSPLEQQPGRPEPLYRQTWFWAVIGVVFVTAFVITFVTLRDRANNPPDTTFGNMHAF